MEAFHNITEQHAVDANQLCKITNCHFCDQVQCTDQGKVLIHCTKLSGSPHPIRVNLNVCLSCTELDDLNF